MASVGDDPLWSEPCPNEGTDLLVIGDGTGKPSVAMYICRKHIVQIPSARLVE
jgi:hypothetical protein